MTVICSKLTGFGHYLPEKVLTNHDLEKMVETNDQWITERTGIKKRHIAKDDEYTSELAFKAATKALEYAKIDAADIDLIVMGTTTPDNTFPSTATKLQGMLGAKGCAFDVQAVCSGFMYAMTMADNMMKMGQAKKALVVGADTLSKIVDWTDRNTCVLFGDGAGAVVLEAVETEENEKEGVLSTKIYSDGRLYDSLATDGGPSITKTAGFIHMNGKEVFKHAITNLTSVANEVISDAGLSVEDVDWLVPHQANIRIIEGTGKKLGIAHEKVVITVQNHANTSAASIPLALSENVNSGKIKKGDVVVINAMGGGFTWGAGLIKI